MATSLGQSVIYDQEITPAEIELRSQIVKLKALHPDAIFLNVGLNQIGPFIKQLREQGIVIPVYSNFWAGKKDVITSAGEAGEGIIFDEMSTNLENLKTELVSRFQSTPSGATLSAYVATMMLGQAAAKMTGTNASELYNNLLQIKTITTRNGNFDVKDRVIQFPMTLRVIRNSKVEDLIAD